MTTRLHRLWQPGGPQRRVFLPNFWMKLVKPAWKIPPNHVHFKIPLQMTKYDVIEYLREIYKLPVKTVRTTVIAGKIYRDIPRGYKLTKDPDEKMAYVTLDKNVKFEFPELIPEKTRKGETKYEKRMKKEVNAANEQQLREWTRPGLPGFFGL